MKTGKGGFLGLLRSAIAALEGACFGLGFWGAVVAGPVHARVVRVEGVDSAGEEEGEEEEEDGEEDGEENGLGEEVPCSCGGGMVVLRLEREEEWRRGCNMRWNLVAG